MGWRSLARCSGRMAALLAGLALAIAPAHGQTQPADANAPSAKRAIVVLDSSAAMLAPLETFKKYYLVRKDLQAALTNPLAGVDVGLLAYGHRRRSACDDVELLRPVEPFDARVFFRGLTSVRPKGRSPLAAALRVAGDALPVGGRQGGKILLVAGAPDNCQGDPCAAAAELVAADPTVSIDVVWLADPAPDLTQAQCIAKAGRGRLFTANSMADAEHMLGEAFAGLGSAATAMPSAANTGPGGKAADGAPGLNLSVRLGTQSETYAGKVSWSVRKAAATAQLDGAVPADGQLIAHADTPTVYLPLPPGGYQVEVSAGSLTQQQTVEVRENEASTVVLTLNAGTVQLKATTAKALPPQDSVYVTVYRLGATVDDAPETVAVMPMPAEPLLLSQGNYRIVASLRDIRSERTVAVTAGAVLASEFALSTGQLQIETPIAVDAVLAAGMSNIAYFVSEDDPEQPLGQRDVGRSALPNPSFDLKPGIYHVYARAGAAQAHVDAVVKAGETTRISLPIVTGRLQLAPMSIEGGSEIPKGLISYTIERLDAAGAAEAVIARNSLGDSRIDLEAGRYRVTGRVGLVNVVASTEAVVRPGAETRIELKPLLALLSLQFGDTPGSVPDVLWEIRAGGGKVVWSTTDTSPLVPLAPGNYEVHAYRAGHDRSTAVSLTPDERRTVVIRPE